MVLALNGDAGLFQLKAHFVADVLLGIGRGHGEVTFLGPDFVTEIRELFLPAVPVAFHTVDQVKGGIAGVAETDFIKDEELGLGAEIGGVGDPGALEVGLGFFGDAAGITVVRLARDRVDDGADERERFLGVKDVDPGRGRVGDDEHVAGIDGAPAADAGAVEAEALGEDLLVVLGEGGGEMLPGAGQVGELEVDEFDFVLLDHLGDVGSGFYFFGHEG